MKLLVVTLLATMSLTSFAELEGSSCLERFEYQQGTTAKGIIGKSGDFLADKANGALGRNRTGNLLVLAKKIKNGDVSFPETTSELDASMVYGGLARTFLKLKSYNGLEMTNMELAEKMIEVDSDLDPINGLNPFCIVTKRVRGKRAGQEKFKMRVFKTNKNDIVRSLLK